MTKEEIMLRASCLQEAFKATNQRLADAREAYREASRGYYELVDIVNVFRTKCDQLLVCMKAQAWAASEETPSNDVELKALPAVASAESAKSAEGA